MSDYNDKKELDKVSRKIMKEVEKEEKKESKILKNCKSELQYQLTKRIRQICKEREIKGEKKIREIFDIYPADLSELKNGKKDVTLQELQRIANSLEVSQLYLLGITDNPKPISTILSNYILGLTTDARYSLIMLYYYGLDEEDMEIVDKETGEINVNCLPNGEYEANFEILSSFIADISNFCDFFTYIKVYVEAKEKGEDLDEIKEKIQKSIFQSLDKIANKRKENEEK